MARPNGHERPDTIGHSWWRVALLLLGLFALGIRLWGLNSAGETWDEIAYYDAAGVYQDNLLAGRWNDANAWIANREHPAVAKWLYLAASWHPLLQNVVDFSGGRMLSAVLGTLTVLLTALIGARLYTRRVGLIAAFILALLPPWIAVNRVLGLDTPTAFFFALTTWLCLEGLSRERGTAWWHSGAIIALGLAIGTRFSNVLLLPFVAAVFLLYRWPDWSHGKRLFELAWAIPFLLVPLAIAFGTWPWLWHDTQAHWEISLGHWSPVAGMFLGVIQYPGWAYFLLYALVSLPGLVVFASLFFLARTLVRGSRADWLLLVWILAVFALSAYGLRQGGIRYLAQLFPAIALAVAVVFEEILTRLNRRAARVALMTIFAAYLILHGLWYQPYQLDYYNEFTGGVAQVADQRSFQVGWWNEGVEPAVRWLNRHAPRFATLSFKPVPDRSQRLLRRDFEHTPAFPDFIVLDPAVTWRVSEWPGLRHYRLIHAVTVRGANLAEVWQRVE